jgi:EmrB/QacA subfamily drug resistance transporter
MHIPRKLISFRFTGPHQSSSALLIGLMFPAIMLSLNFSMVSVALPTIRDHYQIQADQTAWIFIAYLLPFTIFMPLYGRLGDSLGQRSLYIAGITIFLTGTVLTLLAPTLGWLMVGWAIQGLGASGIVPLSMALITQLFPPDEWGKQLGTWDSVRPLMGIIGLFVGGLLVDYFGWRTVFIPVLIIGLLALFVVKRDVPVTTSATGTQFRLLYSFDWIGVILLGATVLTLMVYASSRPVTGIAALQDWRFLVITLVLLGVFILWERRHTRPFVSLNIFSTWTFSAASLGSLIRFFAISGIIFLTPLYLRDIRGLSASSIGIMLTVHSAALLLTLRLGGQLADRWGSRWPVAVGLFFQAVVMIYFAFLPQTVTIWLIMMGVALNGLAAGLSMAALNRAAMSDIAEDQKGLAAGLFGMIRASGFVFGTALVGVVLQNGLDRMSAPIMAYQVAYLFVAGVALLGTIVSIKLE